MFGLFSAEGQSCFSSITSTSRAIASIRWRNLTLWDNRLARHTLHGSPQMTNTQDTESPSRGASRCSWPSNRVLSSEGSLISCAAHASTDYQQPNASVCKPWSLPCCLESCLTHYMNESILMGLVRKRNNLFLFFIFWLTAKLLKIQWLENSFCVLLEEKMGEGQYRW